VRKRLRVSLLHKANGIIQQEDFNLFLTLIFACSVPKAHLFPSNISSLSSTQQILFKHKYSTTTFRVFKYDRCLLIYDHFTVHKQIQAGLTDQRKRIDLASPVLKEITRILIKKIMSRFHGALCAALYDENNEGMILMDN